VRDQAAVFRHAEAFHRKNAEVIFVTFVDHDAYLKLGLSSSQQPSPEV